MYKDPSRPIKERVADLVSRMTLEKKIPQMIYDAPAIEWLSILAHDWWNECLHGVGRPVWLRSFPRPSTEAGRNRAFFSNLWIR